MNDEEANFQQVTADVEAWVDDAEERGYKRGLIDGKQMAFNTVYRECLGDVVERLKTNAEFKQEGYLECISEIEKMMDH